MITLLLFYLIGVILAIAAMTFVFYKHGKLVKKEFHHIIILSILFSYITFFAALGSYVLLEIDSFEHKNK